MFVVCDSLFTAEPPTHRMDAISGYDKIGLDVWTAVCKGQLGDWPTTGCCFLDNLDGIDFFAVLDIAGQYIRRQNLVQRDPLEHTQSRHSHGDPRACLVRPRRALIECDLDIRKTGEGNVRGRTDQSGTDDSDEASVLVTRESFKSILPTQ